MRKCCYKPVVRVKLQCGYMVVAVVWTTVFTSVVVIELTSYVYARFCHWIAGNYPDAYIRVAALHAKSSIGFMQAVLRMTICLMPSPVSDLDSCQGQWARATMSAIGNMVGPCP